jgi:pimeloyl-ACP methyl ester carboxylesterase
MPVPHLSPASPQRKRWRTGLLAVSLALLVAALLGTGRQNMTNYRSAVGAQQPSRVVLHGISISYSDSGGSGPVVICLHAIGHGARDFEDLSRRLSPGYRVISRDFPNHGNSRADSQPASGTRYTEILAQFIDELHLPTVVLLGNSIGGAVSIRYASLYPERVKAMVLCDSGGLGPPGLYRRVRAILRCRQARRLLVSVGFCSLLPKSSTETGRAGRTRANYSLSVRDCAHSGASVAKLQ